MPHTASFEMSLAILKAIHLFLSGKLESGSLLFREPQLQVGHSLGLGLPDGLVEQIGSLG